MGKEIVHLINFQNLIRAAAAAAGMMCPLVCAKKRARISSESLIISLQLRLLKPGSDESSFSS